MDEKESVGPEQSTPVEAEFELYRGFKSAGLNDIDAFRTVQAVRGQAGHRINETLEVHRKRVGARIHGFETRLTAKIDGVETNLTAKIDIFKADTAKQHTELSAELKAMRRELTYFRWCLLYLIALLTLLAAYGLLPSIKQWFWPDSTPAQSLQAPVESDPPETAVPPETNPPDPTPQ